MCGCHVIKCSSGILLLNLKRLIIGRTFDFPQNSCYANKRGAEGWSNRNKGNVVNVPADVIKTVRFIHKNMNDSETIPVKFKRSLNFKSYIAWNK